jgi:hypothetical protein
MYAAQSTHQRVVVRVVDLLLARGVLFAIHRQRVPRAQHGDPPVGAEGVR